MNQEHKEQHKQGEHQTGNGSERRSGSGSEHSSGNGSEHCTGNGSEHSSGYGSGHGPGQTPGQRPGDRSEHQSGHQSGRDPDSVGRRRFGAVPFSPEQGYCRIKAFDLNSPEHSPLGVPPALPADSYLISGYKDDRQIHVLLDAGKPGQGERIIIPELLAEGIRHLDWVILSHMHRDHYGGIIDLLRDSRISIGQLAYSPIPESILLKENPGASEHWRELHDRLTAAPFPLRVLTEKDTGTRLQLTEELSFDVVAVPDCEFMLRTLDRQLINNLNLVLKMNYRDFTALFPGDAGRPQAGQILTSPQRELISGVTLVKAAHHAKGESLSDEMIAACDAKIVIIPCNDQVTAGPDFIANWHAYSRNGAKVYRMDQLRRVSLYTDGRSATVYAEADGFAETTEFFAW